MTITVIGATGKVGTLVARGLLAEGAAGAGPGPRPRQGPRSARPRFPPGDPRQQDLDRAGGRTASTPARTALRPPTGENLHTDLATTEGKVWTRI
jgi:nucleoside-diphosphate-sugar epimerase